MPLTDRQRVLLVNDTVLWINIAASVGRGTTEESKELTEILSSAEGSFDADPKQVAKILRVAVVNVHMLAIALRQIDRHLEFLVSDLSGEAAESASNSRTLYASSEMKDFRDVLEHSADYVAGRGLKPELKQDETAGYGVLAVNGRIRGVTVFGKTHDVLPVIQAALELMPLLRGLDGKA